MENTYELYPTDGDSIESLPAAYADANRGHADAQSTPSDPLLFWRRLSVRNIGPDHIENLRDRLAEFFLFRGLAYAGDYDDPARAVGAAVAVLTDEDGSDAIIEDVCMSRLLCCALQGDRACAWILAGVLDRRSRTDAHCRGLSEGWRRLAKARHCHDLSPT